VVERTRSRLDVPKVRTIFGTAQRPRRTRKRSSTIEAAIETPTFDLTVFKLHFGRLTGKAYTKGERVLRFEAIAHNTAELRCGSLCQLEVAPGRRLELAPGMLTTPAVRVLVGRPTTDLAPDVA
ncbi:MAG: hypothetical protein ACRDTK_22375, partial [Mycobacterium sp.]